MEGGGSTQVAGSVFREHGHPRLGLCDHGPRLHSGRCTERTALRWRVMGGRHGPEGRGWEAAEGGGARGEEEDRGGDFKGQNGHRSRFYCETRALFL